MALTTTIQVNIEAQLSKALDLLGTPTTHSIPLIVSLNKALANGTGVLMSDTVFADRRPLTTGQSEDLDLAGTLLNSYGDAAIFAKVRLLYIKSADDNTVDLTVFGDAASVPFLNTAATTSTIKPGGFILLYNPTGFTVTPTTADIVQVANGAGNSTYDILIIGTSV